MSSSQQYQVSTASLQTSATPTDSEAYRLKDQSDPQAHTYHTLEEARSAKTQVDSPTEPVEYEEFVRLDYQQYHELEPPSSNQQSSNPTQYEQFTPAQGGKKPANSAYQPLQMQTRPKPGIYMKPTQTPSDSGVYEAVTKTSTISPNATQQRSGSPPQDYRLQTDFVRQVEGTPKKHLPIKVAVVCIAVLILVVVTAIATAALVLALTGKCECRDDDIDEALRLARENYDKLQELEEDPEEVIGNFPGGFTDLISTNQENIDKNAEFIAANTEQLGLAMNRISRVNRTLTDRISNIVLVRDLGNIATDCATTIDSDSGCTILPTSVTRTCNTDLVQLKREGQLTIGFACVIEPTGGTIGAPIATPTLNEENGVVWCRCSRMPGINIDITCGVAVTRCSLSTDGDA